MDQAAIYDLIDLDRYPLDNLSSQDGCQLIESIRASLNKNGSCSLAGFVRETVIKQMAVEAKTLQQLAYAGPTKVSPYFFNYDLGKGSEIAEDHPLRRKGKRNLSQVATDLIPENHLLSRLYYSPIIADFLSVVLQQPVYRNQDKYQSLNLETAVGSRKYAQALDAPGKSEKPLITNKVTTSFPYSPCTSIPCTSFSRPTAVSRLNISMMNNGGCQQWHFDSGRMVTTLLLQAPETGGVFEYVPELRSDENENFEEVRKVLDGDLSRARQIKLEAGTFSLFRGHYSMHHVTEVQGDQTRIQAILGFSTTPDLHGNLESSILHYGPRVAELEGIQQ